jgi:hypothetical protein
MIKTEINIITILIINVIKRKGRKYSADSFRKQPGVKRPGLFLDN